MEQEQPKDYEIEIERVFEETYNALPFYKKILYHLQDFILLALVTAFLAGYLAGITFGKFW